MDYICKFLSLDLCELLFCLYTGSGYENSAVFNQNEVKSLSRTLRHNYPKRLVTYDAAKLNEPRLVRFSDLSESVLSILKPICQEESKKEQTNIKQELTRSCPSFDLCKKFSSQRLAQLESCSKSIHERYSECQLAKAGQKQVEWNSLKPMEKVYFYWEALTGNQLHSTPYANFKQVFAQRYQEQCPCGSLKQMRAMMRRCWRNLSSDERVPFKLHALLYHVSNGSVDPSDHCAVRVLLNRWH